MAILMQNFVGGGGGERRTRGINMGDVQIECIEDKFLVTTPPSPEFQVTGGKTQHPKKSLGLPTKPPKIPCRIKFPRHKNFQKAYWISKKIPAWIKLPKNILAKIFLTIQNPETKNNPSNITVTWNPEYPPYGWLRKEVSYKRVIIVLRHTCMKLSLFQYFFRARRWKQSLHCMYLLKQTESILMKTEPCARLHK